MGQRRKCKDFVVGFVCEERGRRRRRKFLYKREKGPPSMTESVPPRFYKTLVYDILFIRSSVF